MRWIRGFLSVVAPLCVATAAAAAPNLVPNGDFEFGNTLFGSEYAYSPGSNSTEGQYTVRSDTQPWNSGFVNIGDHTPGAGTLMFVGNGAPLDQRVWYVDDVVVTPGTDYFFEAFVANLCCVTGVLGSDGVHPVNPAVLSFYANGSLLGTRTTSLVGVFEGLSTTWNSGLATTVDLELRNANFVAIGNDFAVDDIFLGLESTVALPEPATVALFGGALLGTALIRRRRKPQACKPVC